MISKGTVLRLLVGVLAITFSHCLSSEQELEIDSLVRDVFMAESDIPGVGVTIVENFGESTFSKGYGHSDIDRNITADENTKFCIASITKTFTATLVMKVLSETFPELGPAVIDTPLRILHPNGTFMFSDRFRYETMSFRDLLSHRVAVQTESFGSSAGAFKDIDEFTFRSRYAPEVASFRAGGFYSNTLLALAGTLIAEIAEQPYEELLQDFFDQLEMNDSILIDEQTNYDQVVNMSRGYFIEYGVVKQLNSALINRVFVGAPSGGIITTANDMAKYMTFHLNNGRVGDRQIVSQEALLWMRQPAAPLDFMQFRSVNSSMVAGSYAMGSGVQLGVFDGWEFVSHTGQWVTFQSELRIYPRLGFATFSVNNGPIHLSNSRYDHFFLQNSFFAIVNGLSSGVKINPTNQHLGQRLRDATLETLEKYLAGRQLPSQNINQESYVGNFGHPVEGDMEITLRNETLYFRFGIWASGYLNQHPTYPVYYVIWDSDFVQDIYFAAGGLIDIFFSFESENTFSVIFEQVTTFQRGLSLDTLPLIPWEPESCAPGQEEEEEND
ncbi:uncharacterized protein LOC119076674 [Bradysia coprophila]|uniref:uncharacterized protein LOC119076674 n=1 Tax=Bradysia coprophila TaxID=38358 RepID=UPI00187DC312|nr:uncharacterized protein LOC119076674 [Bradysia coprophila]